MDLSSSWRQWEEPMVSLAVMMLVGRRGAAMLVHLVMVLQWRTFQRMQLNRTGRMLVINDVCGDELGEGAL